MASAKKIIGAGIVGTAIGATAGAASMILSDKKKREKALKQAKELRKKAEETAHDLQKKAKSIADKIEEVKDEFLKKSQQPTEEQKKAE